MTIWPPAPDAIERPAYRSLARHLSDAIEAGELRPGDRLPTHRELAWQLGLSVQTVSRAYEELARSGSIAGEVGRGTYVRGRAREAEIPYQRLDGSEDLIDCSMLTPVTDELHHRLMADTLREMAEPGQVAKLQSFRPRKALTDHVQVALGWLERCGVRTRPDRVIPTNGSTPALAGALMSATGPGDLVVTEALGHHTLRGLCQNLGLRLTGLAADDEGVCPDDFARLCSSDRVRVLHAMPAGQGATAGLMGAERRAELVAIARRHDVLIVENQAWGPLETGQPPPLAALAPERTFYLTGLTKCLMPGLRVGWLVPPATHREIAAACHLTANWMVTPLVAEIATRWIRDGTARWLLHWQRRHLARRNRIARQALGGVPHRVNPHGLHVWMPLSRDWAEVDFLDASRRQGVAVAAGASFAADDRPTPPGVRICLGAPDEAELAAALARLANLAQDGKPASPPESVGTAGQQGIAS